MKENSSMKNIQMTGRVLRPLLERQRSAWSMLSFFAETPKAEAEFWLRFLELPPEDKEFLSAFWRMPNPYYVFRRICVFWNVRVADGQPENLE
jgi:hypothetical protein